MTAIHDIEDIAEIKDLAIQRGVERHCSAPKVAEVGGIQGDRSGLQRNRSGGRSAVIPTHSPASNATNTVGSELAYERCGSRIPQIHAANIKCISRRERAADGLQPEVSTHGGGAVRLNHQAAGSRIQRDAESEIIRQTGIHYVRMA